MYPVYLQLREHHCVSPTEPAPCGGNPIDNDDGINNAWLPPTIEVQEGNGIVRLRDTQHLSQSIVYETFVEGKKNSHHPDTCKVCVQKQRTADLLLAEKVRQSKKKAHRAASSTRAATSTRYSPTDGEDTVRDARAAMNTVLGDGQDVDELVDEVMSEGGSSLDDVDSDDDAEIKTEATCTGIKDILITGQVCPLLCRNFDDDTHSQFPYFSRLSRVTGKRGITSSAMVASALGMAWLPSSECPSGQPAASEFISSVVTSLEDATWWEPGACGRAIPVQCHSRARSS